MSNPQQRIINRATWLFTLGMDRAGALDLALRSVSASEGSRRLAKTLWPLASDHAGRSWVANFPTHRAIVH